MLSVLFFGQLRERLNTERLTVDVSILVKPHTVASLFIYLSDKGLHWQELIRADNCLVAVNQTMATQNTLISADDEVALFPPVTGG